MTHRLTSHGGAVELARDRLDGLTTARRCDCSFCRRRAANAATAPQAGVRHTKPQEALGYTPGAPTPRRIISVGSVGSTHTISVVRIRTNSG
mgnify:CR=1 FL=1